jgi:hypothetical protein
VIVVADRWIRRDKQDPGRVNWSTISRQGWSSFVSRQRFTFSHYWIEQDRRGAEVPHVVYLMRASLGCLAERNLRGRRGSEDIEHERKTPGAETARERTVSMAQLPGYVAIPSSYDVTQRISARTPSAATLGGFNLSCPQETPRCLPLVTETSNFARARWLSSQYLRIGVAIGDVLMPFWWRLECEA